MMKNPSDDQIMRRTTRNNDDQTGFDQEIFVVYERTFGAWVLQVWAFDLQFIVLVSTNTPSIDSDHIATPANLRNSKSAQFCLINLCQVVELCPRRNSDSARAKRPAIAIYLFPQNDDCARILCKTTTPTTFMVDWFWCLTCMDLQRNCGSSLMMNSNTIGMA